ncbi:hypothetical protein BaRGS_00039015 [Batillaria attramentaria]|uniref:Uncharacterized protein n=1 Tax=Batillaria attramentaria TaxID=370345 RepID=A0ABD0J4I9_9CAEN
MPVKAAPEQRVLTTSGRADLHVVLGGQRDAALLSTSLPTVSGSLRSVSGESTGADDFPRVNICFRCNARSVGTSFYRNLSCTSKHAKLSVTKGKENGFLVEKENV